MNAELISKLSDYKQYSRMIEELEALKNSIADELKAVMIAEGVEKKIIGEYKLSYTDAIRKDIDRKRLEAENMAVYNKYLTSVSQYRKGKARM